MGYFKNFILGILTGIVVISIYYLYTLKIDIENLSDELNHLKENRTVFHSPDNKNIGLMITEAVKKVTPSVVGINVMKFKDENIKKKIKDPLGLLTIPPTYKVERKIREVKSNGSGFIISKDGYLITNEHVIHNASEILVTTTEGNKYEATIIGADEKSDIAVLKIGVDNHTFTKFGKSNKLNIGEWVLALGNPYGLFEFNNKPLVTLGIISGLGINFGNSKFNNRFYTDMIQTDASINPGNSGGPLINIFGEVIGLNTMIYSESGGGSVGIGFVTPISKVLRIKDQLIENGYVNRAIDYGFELIDIDKDISKKIGKTSSKGVLVTSVHDHGSAKEAGFVEGDIIVALENYNIENKDDIHTIVKDSKDFIVGDSLRFIVNRDDKIYKINMELLPINRLN
ncbi:MAG: 2-alkenal reductase [Candidatus Cloacimonadota bacterium]|nr:MAG: 2-alkenal reductase [Candidatus Cloacimonadota bacterium]PIE78461.1 MAG: 2-alkenal reductase [Candidatus Delongbacteria bacterium]